MEIEKPYWQFIGECALDAKGNHLTSREDYVLCLELSAFFLRQHFALPPDCILRVLWSPTPHTEGKFPIIALGYEQSGDKQMIQYAGQLRKALEIFDKSVDWRAITSDQLPELPAEDKTS